MYRLLHTIMALCHLRRGDGLLDGRRHCLFPNPTSSLSMYYRVFDNASIPQPNGLFLLIRAKRASNGLYDVRDEACELQSGGENAKE